VGVRKAIGAVKAAGIQFIGETIFLAMISIFLSAGFAALILHWLNDLPENKYRFRFLQIPPLSPAGAIAISVGVLAYFYPALVLSSFKLQTF
jgi:hypothetical protein